MFKLNESGSLKELVLVGSWCLPIYSKIYSGNSEIQMLRTKDIDFLVQNPKNISKHIDVNLALQEIGFEPSFDVDSILTKYDLNGFDIEFLCPYDAAVVTGLGRLIAELPDLQVRTLQIFNEFPKRTTATGSSHFSIFQPWI